MVELEHDFFSFRLRDVDLDLRDDFVPCRRGGFVFAHDDLVRARRVRLRPAFVFSSSVPHPNPAVRACFARAAFFDPPRRKEAFLRKKGRDQRGFSHRADGRLAKADGRDGKG